MSLPALIGQRTFNEKSKTAFPRADCQEVAARLAQAVTETTRQPRSRYYVRNRSAGQVYMLDGVMVQRFNTRDGKSGGTVSRAQSPKVAVSKRRIITPAIE